MAPKKPGPAPHTRAVDSTRAVDEFMDKLDHAFKAEVQAIRSSILGADPGIAEGVKWNAPSFRTQEYFATINLREKNGVGVVLHLGAKVRELEPGGISIADPEHLLKWLAKDRAMIVFQDMPYFLTRKYAFESLVRDWIRCV